MQMLNPSISLCRSLSAKSCADHRQLIPLLRLVPRMTMSREESERKQLAYELGRAKWRKECARVKT
jgi:hypothetical protein